MCSLCLLVIGGHEAWFVQQCQGFDLASTMAIVQLSPIDGQQLLLNYQIVTYDSTNPPLHGFWWETVIGGFNSVQVRGVSDGVDIYGLPLREPGAGGYLYTIDIADRLTQLLSTKGLDPDEWQVAGFYSGSYTYGQARIVLKHGLFSLVGIAHATIAV